MVVGFCVAATEGSDFLLTIARAETELRCHRMLSANLSSDYGGAGMWKTGYSHAGLIKRYRLPRKIWANRFHHYLEPLPRANIRRVDGPNEKLGTAMFRQCRRLFDYSFI
jgi:hypothetical protein